MPARRLAAGRVAGGGRADDRWLAIAPESPDQWAGLAAVVGAAEWPGRDPASGEQAAGEWAAEERAAEERAVEALGRAVCRWAADRDVTQAAADLQARGVPTSAVQEPWELLRADPQLAARGFYRQIEHPACGVVATSRLPVVFSATQPAVRRPAPLLGEHNAEILGGILGLNDAEIGDLVGREVV